MGRAAQGFRGSTNRCEKPTLVADAPDEAFLMFAATAAPRRPAKLIGQQFVRSDVVGRLVPLRTCVLDAPPLEPGHGSGGRTAAVFG
jgi:hypothetical protein